MDEHTIKDFLNGAASEAGSQRDAGPNSDIQYIYHFRDRFRNLNLDGSGDVVESNDESGTVDNVLVIESGETLVVESESEVEAKKKSDGSLEIIASSSNSESKSDYASEKEETKVNKQALPESGPIAKTLLDHSLQMLLGTLQLNDMHLGVDEKGEILTKVVDALASISSSDISLHACLLTTTLVTVPPSPPVSPQPDPELLTLREQLEDQTAAAVAIQADLDEIRKRFEGCVRRLTHIFIDRGDLDPRCRSCQMIRGTVMRTLFENDDLE